MKINAIKVVGRRLPEGIALIEIETDAGVTGIGATAAWIPAVAALIEKGSDRGAPGFEATLLGEDATEPARLWHKMVDSGAFGRSREGGLAVNAMSAIDMALWDIAGKASGLPIYKLLGGAVQQEVMVYASTSAFAPEPSPLRRRPIDDIMRECRIYLEQGFKAIKLGWGNHFSPQDEETLSAVREAIGPDVHLMLDFGCPAYLTHGWTAKDAVRVTRIAEKYGIFFLEEALKPDDVDGFAELTANANIRIATGESLTTLTEFQRFFLPPSGRD